MIESDLHFAVFKSEEFAYPHKYLDIRGFPTYKHIVLDTNQVTPFLAIPDIEKRNWGVTLSPYVFAQTIVRPVAPEIMRQLSSLDVLIGLEPWQVMERIANLDERAIIDFVPHDKRFVLPKMVTPEMVSRARIIKQMKLAFVGKMFDAAKEFRRRMRDRGQRLRLSNFSEALDLSILKSFVFQFISNGESRATVVSDREKLYGSVMQNQYLSRYFRTILYYLISYSRAWADKNRNFNPTDTPDDWTDWTLLLYAANGDTILTKDGKLRNALSMIDPSQALCARTAQDL